MRIANRLATGAVWVTAARVFVSLIGLLSTIVLARLLSPGDYGLVAIASGVLAIVESFTGLPLANALIQLEEPTDEHLHAAWTMGLLRSLAVAAVLLAAAHPASLIYDDPRLFHVVAAFAGISVISGLRNPRLALLSKQLVFRQEFVLSAGSKLFGFVTAVSVALLYRSYWALVAGWAAAQAGTTILSYALAPYRPRFAHRRMRDLWSFTIWLTLCDMMNTVTWRIDQLFVGAALGARAAGIYTVGSDLAGLPTREATAPLTYTIFPGFVAVASSPERLRMAVLTLQSLVFGLVVPIGVGLALLAEPFVLLVLGPQWNAAIFIVQLMACLYALQTINVTAQPLAMATGKTKMLFGRDVLVFVTRTPLVLLGLYFGGLQGLIIGRVTAGLIHILINLRFVARIIDVGARDQLAATWRSWVSLAVMCAVVASLETFMSPDVGYVRLAAETFSIVAAGGVAYHGTHILLWLACGRPQGPEAKLLELLAPLLGRLRARRRPA